MAIDGRQGLGSAAFFLYYSQNAMMKPIKQILPYLPFILLVLLSALAFYVFFARGEMS